MAPTSSRRNSKAFTLFEAVVTLVIIGVVSSITFVGIRSVQDAAGDRALSTQMDAVRAAGRSVAAANGGEFPADTIERLPLNGLTASDGPSLNTTQVSAWVISPTRIGYAVADGRGGCIGVWDDLVRTGESSVVWLYDAEVQEGNCLGKVIYAQDPRIVLVGNHDWRDPDTIIDFDGGFPDLVTDITVTQTSPTRILVDWEMPEGPTTDQFVIERASGPARGTSPAPLGDPAEFNYEPVGEVNSISGALPATEWADNNPPAGVDLYYRLRARGKVLQLLSPPSAPFHILSSPPTPETISGTATPVSTEVTFTPSVGEIAPAVDSYRLYVNGFLVSPSFSPTDQFSWTHTPSFTEAPWETGVVFTYAIEACNNTGCSNRRSVAVSSAPDAPTVTATGEVGYVLLSWPDVPTAATYTVMRSAGAVGTAGWVGTFADTVSTTSTALTGATSLQVDVRSTAYEAAGFAEVAYGSGSNGVVVTPGVLYAASAQVATSGPATGAFMRIRWYDAAGRPLQVSDGSVDTRPSATVSVSATAPPTAAFASPAVVAQGVEHTGDSSFKVDSVSMTANGTSTSMLPSGAGDFEQTATSMQTVGLLSSTSVPLWQAQSNTSVRRETSQGNFYAALRAASTGSVAAFSHPSPATGFAVDELATYSASVSVRASNGTRPTTLDIVYYNTAGVELSRSSASTSASTSAFQTLSVSSSAAPADARYARLFVSATGMSGTQSVQIDNVAFLGNAGNMMPAPASNFTNRGYADTGVRPGSSASYEVRAVNAGGVSGLPGTADARPERLPNATTLRSFTPGMRTAQVAWYPLSDTAAAPVTSWQVWYSVGGADWVFGCATTADTCQIVGLTEGTTVSAVAVPISDGSFGALSNSLSGVIKGPASAPQNVTIRNQFSTAVVVDWDYPTQDWGVPVTQWRVYENGGAPATVPSARPTAWAANASNTVQQTTERVRNGAGSAKLTSTSGGTASINLGSATQRIVPLFDERSTSLSACVFLSGSRSVTASITPYTRAGSGHTPITATTVLPGGSWQCLTASGTLPFDVYTAALRIDVAGTAAGEVVYVDDVGFLVNGATRLVGAPSNFDRMSTLLVGKVDGTNYTYDVDAFNGTFWSTRSPVSAAAAPAHLMTIPQSPSIIGLSAPDTTTLTLTRSSLATGGANGFPRYNFLASWDGVIAGWQTAATVNWGPGLAAGTTYCVKMTAVNGAGTSPAGPQVCLATLPDAPGWSTWSNTPNTIRVIHGGVVGALEYQVYSNYDNSYVLNTNGIRDQGGIPNCTAVGYQVRARSSGGWGAWSGAYYPRTECYTSGGFYNPNGWFRGYVNANWNDSAPAGGGTRPFGPSAFGVWAQFYRWNDGAIRTWTNSSLGGGYLAPSCSVRLTMLSYYNAGLIASVTAAVTTETGWPATQPTGWGRQQQDGPHSSSSPSWWYFDASFGHGCWRMHPDSGAWLSGTVVGWVLDGTWPYQAAGSWAYGGNMTTSQWPYDNAWPLLTLTAWY